jgi:hypothetical protein
MGEMAFDSVGHEAESAATLLAADFDAPVCPFVPSSQTEGYWERRALLLPAVRAARESAWASLASWGWSSVGGGGRRQIAFSPLASG